jgi:hypothetical protein
MDEMAGRRMTPMDPGTQGRSQDAQMGRVELLDGSAERQSLRSTPPATRRGQRSGRPERSASAAWMQRGCGLQTVGTEADRYGCTLLERAVRRPFALPARLRQRHGTAEERATGRVRVRCSRPRLPVTAQIRRGWA